MIKTNYAKIIALDTVLIVVIAIIGLILISSCTTQKRFNRIADKHQDWLASKCLSDFPIDTTTKTNTVYIKADNTDWTDTINSLNEALTKARNTVKTDTIYNEKDCNNLLQAQSRTINKLGVRISNLQANYKKCAPDTLRITKTLTVKDTRELFLAKKDNDKLKADLESTKWYKNFWMTLGLIALAVHLVRFLIRR